MTNKNEESSMPPRNSGQSFLPEFSNQMNSGDFFPNSSWLTQLNKSANIFSKQTTRTLTNSISAMEKISSMGSAVSKQIFNLPYVNPYAHISKRLTDAFAHQSSYLQKTVSNISFPKVTSMNFIPDVAKAFTKINQSLQTVFPHLIRYNFAQKNCYILLDNFTVQRNTKATDYIKFLVDNESNIFQQILRTNDSFTLVLSKINESVDYRLILPFLYSYIEYLFRQLFSDDAEFKIGNFNHRNIIKPPSKKRKFESLDQQIEEMQLNNFILIMDIATFLYPKFDDDPDGTYRNSIDHGKSSPDKWTKDSYLNVLAAVLRLQSAVRLEGKRESDNKK